MSKENKEKREKIAKSDKLWLETGEGIMEPIKGYATYEIIETESPEIPIVNFYGEDEVPLTTQGSQVFTEYKPDNPVKECPIFTPETLKSKSWEKKSFPAPKYDRTIHQQATREVIDKLGIKVIILPDSPGKKTFHESRIVEICLDPNGEHTTLTWLNAHKTPRVTESDATPIIKAKPSDSINN